MISVSTPYIVEKIAILYLPLSCDLSKQTVILRRCQVGVYDLNHTNFDRQRFYLHRDDFYHGAFQVIPDCHRGLQPCMPAGAIIKHANY